TTGAHALVGSTNPHEAGWTLCNSVLGVSDFRRDGSVAARCSAVTLEHHQHRSEQDCQVHREAPMTEIPEVVRELRRRLVGACGITLTYLGPARQARLYQVPMRPVGEVLAQIGEELRSLGARPNQ